MKMSRLRCEAARSKRWKVPAVSSTPNPKNEDGEKKTPLARPGKPRKCMCVTIICMSYIYGIIYIMYVCLWCTVFLYDISTYIRVYHASFCDVWPALLLLYYFTVLNEKKPVLARFFIGFPPILNLLEPVFFFA